MAAVAWLPGLRQIDHFVDTVALLRNNRRALEIALDSIDEDVAADDAPENKALLEL